MARANALRFSMLELAADSDRSSTEEKRGDLASEIGVEPPDFTTGLVGSTPSASRPSDWRWHHSPRVAVAALCIPGLGGLRIDNRL
jgi:hypothetical protein